MDKHLKDPYWDVPIITRRQLQETVESTVNRTLESLGLVSRHISRSEIVKQISERKYNYGVLHGMLHPIKKGGRNAKIYILRTEFEEYMATTILEDGTSKPIIIRNKRNTNL